MNSGYERDVFEVVSRYTDIKNDFPVGIKRLCLHSNQVEPGDCFIALPGMTSDGRTYVTQAISNGAVAILQESLGEFDALEFVSSSWMKIPIISIKNLVKVLGYIASNFYNFPSNQAHMIGVTGTNGKTSVAYFLTRALSMLNRPTAMIGSIGVGQYDQLQVNEYTTPDTINTHQSISTLLDQGAQNIVMEVSSHGIAQGRVCGVSFDTFIWTNIKNHEHLDFHGTFENYKQVKTSIFTDSLIKNRIFNIDDATGLELFKRYQDRENVYAYLVGPPALDIDINQVIYATDIVCSLSGLSFALHTPWGNAIVKTEVLGNYNTYNLMAVVIVLALHNIPFVQIIRSISKLSNVPGRMDMYGRESQHKPVVIVDYAHTPDALELVLKQLAEETTGKLICVFGCGGNRHKGKRHLMGEVASRLCDRIYLTDDNPRNESASQIIDDITEGIIHECELVVEHDRLKAIMTAISSATKDDIILVAGKGHETTQVMKGYELELSDIEQVQHQLSCYKINEQ